MSKRLFGAALACALAVVLSGGATPAGQKPTDWDSALADALNFGFAGASNSSNILDNRTPVWETDSTTY